MLVYPFLGDKELFGFIRMGGPGLGNLLFPYARAFIYSKQLNGELIPPVWPTIKIGPLLRNELDSRFYWGLFKEPLYIKFLRFYKYYLNKKIDEEDFLNGYDITPNKVLKVHGLRNYFKDIQGYETALLENILSLASKKVVANYTGFSPRAIGVHIRLGDFDSSSRIKIAWYKQCILKLRSFDSFKDCPAVLFSDGTDDELKEIFQLDNVFRISEPDALSDMLRLSKCNVIIGSNSTFSAWAAFLSSSPFIRPENFYLGRLRSNPALFEGSDITEKYFSEVVCKNLP